MAENTIDIAGASQDLQTIEDFVNLPAGSDVRPRLLPSVNVGTLAGIRDAIFENGGLPATPFATKALMTASALVDGDYAMVTDDTVANNNGLYIKTAGAWIKSNYDPVKVAVKNIEDKKNTDSIAMVHTYEPNRAPYIETGKARTDKLYLKLTGTGVSITKPGATSTGSTYTWATVMTDLGSTAVFKTSPNGVPDCLEMSEQALVLDLNTNKFKLVTRFETKPSEQIILAKVGFGQLVDGELLPLWLKHRSDDVRDMQFYMADGSYASSAPYLEESVGSEPLAMYIKLRSVRLRNRRGTEVRTSWQAIVDEINRPDLIVTSPKGETQCLKLSDDSLVYNLVTKKFKVITGTLTPDPFNEVVVAAAAYGQLIDSLITDWTTSKRLNKLELNSSSGGGSSRVEVIKPLGGSEPKYLAHGGVSGPHFFAPFNSVTAFRLAGEYGYWGIETDLVETKDGEWVLIHDEFLSDYIVDGVGNVKDYTLAELKAMQAGKPSIAYGWDKVQIMELRECLDLCVKYNLVAFLEFKSVPTTAGVNKVVSYIRERMDIRSVVLTSFDKAVLTLIRSLYSDVALAYTSVTVSTTDINFVVNTGNCIFSVNKGASRADIKLIRDAGLEVAIWTLIQPDVDSDKAANCQYVISDLAVPFNFKGGMQTLNFKSNITFSNLTDIGAGVVANRTLKVSGNTAKHNVSVSRGDVITVAFTASTTGAVTVSLSGYNSVGTLLAKYTSRTINKSTDDFYTLSAMGQNTDIATMSIAFEVPSGVSCTLQDIRVKRFEV